MATDESGGEDGNESSIVIFEAKHLFIKMMKNITNEYNETKKLKHVCLIY